MVGRSGCAYVDGVFDHLKDWIKSEKPFEFASLHSQELVVAYVPAEDFKEHSYVEHATHQKHNLGTVTFDWLIQSKSTLCV